jgi:hypothetical protein
MPGSNTRASFDNGHFLLDGVDFNHLCIILIAIRLLSTHAGLSSYPVFFALGFRSRTFNHLSTLNSCVTSLAYELQQQVLDTIVSLYVKLAKSHSVLMGTNGSRSDRDNMREIIIDARKGFRALCLVLARSIMRYSDDDDDDNSETASRIRRPSSDISMRDDEGDLASLNRCHSQRRVGSGVLMAGSRAVPSAATSAASASSGHAPQHHQGLITIFEIILS